MLLCIRLLGYTHVYKVIDCILDYLYIIRNGKPHQGQEHTCLNCFKIV